MKIASERCCKFLIRCASSLSSKALFVRISSREKILEAFDEHTNLLAHFPWQHCAHVEKRPVGDCMGGDRAPSELHIDPKFFLNAEAHS